MIDWILIASVLTYLYCITQVCLFGASIVRYIWPLVNRLKDLKKSQALIHEISSSISEIKVRRITLEEKLFEGVQWAQSHFQHFAAAWRDARFHGEEKAACTVRLKSFLTPQIVINSAANQKTAEALPGFFLAGGIFGTFLGIVFGLAGVNLTQSVQTDVMLQGVRGIIEGMKLAFITSLIGIITSVAFSWWHRSVVRRLEMVVEEIDTTVSEVYPCITDEYYARQFLENLVDIKVQFQTLATDIATNISNSMVPALDTAVSKHLVPIVGEMQDIMNRFFQRADENQSKAVEEMLQRYVNMLQGSFADQINKIMQMIEETSKAQEEIRKSVTDFSERLKEQFALQTELLTKTTQTVKYFDDILGDLGDCAADLKQAASTSHEMATLFSDIAKAMEGIKYIKDNLSVLINSLSEDIQELTKYMEELINRMSTALSVQLTGALNSFDDKLAEVLSRFSGTLAETKDTIGELPSLLGDLSGSFDAIATEMDDQKNILAEIKGTTQGLVSENIEKAFEAASSLSTSVEQISTAATSLSIFMDQLKETIIRTENLNQFSEKGEGEKQPEFRNEVSNINWEEFSSLLKAIKQSSNNLSETVHTLIGETLQKIQTANGQHLEEMKHFRTLLQKIETSAENISNTFSDIKNKEPYERKSVFGGFFGR